MWLEAGLWAAGAYPEPDAQNPPAPAVAIDLIGPGSTRRSYAAAFPPTGGGSFLLEYPDLPAGTITFTVQTLDRTGCVMGETPAPFLVTITAGAKNTAQVTIGRSALACGDGGAPNVGHDSGLFADGGSAFGVGDVGAGGVDVPVDAAPNNTADVSVGIIDVPVDVAVEVVVEVAANDVGVLGDVVPSKEVSSLADSPTDTPVDRTSDMLVGGPDSQDGPGGQDVLSSQDSPPPAPPTITSFTASPATISAGSSATLTAIFAGASGSSVDHGIGSISSGNGIGTGPLSSTTTYTLTVINSAGLSASAKATVTVVPLPVIASFAALMPTIACGTLTQLTATFTGGTGSIDQGIGTVASGTGVPTGTLTANTTYTLTVTNLAGDSVTKQATVTVSTAVGSGVFTLTGTPIVGRFGEAAALLPTGQVLIAGGDVNGSAPPSRAELYDPSTGTFTATGAMSTVRDYHVATLLPSGKVLITGGASGGTNLASAELYDPVSGSFVAAGNMTTARANHAAVRLANGKVLVIGGLNGDNSVCLSSAELYDPNSGTFTATGYMSSSRQHFTATRLPNGKVLVAGGQGVSHGKPFTKRQGNSRGRCEQLKHGTLRPEQREFLRLWLDERGPLRAFSDAFAERRGSRGRWLGNRHLRFKHGLVERGAVRP